MEVGINMNEPGMEGNSNNSDAAADEAEAQAEALPEPERPEGKEPKEGEERPEGEPPAVEIHFYSQSMFAGVSNIWP
jgi:hypothetical protein